MFRRIIKKLILPIVVFVVVVSAYFLLFFSFSNGDQLFEIPKNATGIQVAKKLKEYNVISSEFVFLTYIRAFGLSKKIIPGEFLIPKDMGVIGVANYIINPKNIFTYKITLIEGQRVKDFLKLVDSDPILTGKVYSVPEGTMMPDTYHFYKGDTKASIIERSTKAMNDYLDSLWNNRTNDFTLKTKHEVLTLASMVEKESGIPSERELIAGLFFNRMRIGMKLQSDPTVAYGLNKDSADKLTKKDLQTVTPYNTYTKYGLPKGPIANPSKESLKAVFSPVETRNLYFVADGTGGHVFTSSLVEHNKEVAKWRKIEQGIRRREKENATKK